MEKGMEKETFKDIPDYEGFYQVSNFGRIKSLSRKIKCGNGCRNHKERILKPKIDNGYKRVTLVKDGMNNYLKVSRIVMATFNGASNLQVNHINGIKADNRLENLEYCTPSENIYHAFRTGLKHSKKGCDSHFAKLTEPQVRRIKWIAKYSVPEKGYWKKLSTSLGVSNSMISMIVNNKSWKHIQV
ncbi:MAG: endodeoxyribonuclease [archaeon]|nr:endodeoxyribonuclease [archaeon]